LTAHHWNLPISFTYNGFFFFFFIWHNYCDFTNESPLLPYRVSNQILGHKWRPNLKTG
jgi:hypothetical protein